jgi:cyclopropane fatty-acyl-phospholipid synthase-like methyltransferase
MSGKLPVLPGGARPPEARVVDRDRYSLLAHARLRYANPLSPLHHEALLDRLGLGPSSRVVDVGCGQGELLIRLVERFGLHAVGIDASRTFLQAARDAAAARVPDADLQLLLTPVSRWPAEPASFDAAVCLGAVHAYGAFPEALAGLASLVKPGGRIAVGETCWRQPPEPAYLAALGLPGADGDTFESQQADIEDAGLTLLDSHACTTAELDAYETAYRDAILAWCDAHPHDLDAPPMRERALKWWALYDRWGRDTMGFAVHVAARDRAPGPGAGAVPAA